MTSPGRSSKVVSLDMNCGKRPTLYEVSNLILKTKRCTTVANMKFTETGN